MKATAEGRPAPRVPVRCTYCDRAIRFVVAAEDGSPAQGFPLEVCFFCEVIRKHGRRSR